MKVHKKFLVMFTDEEIQKIIEKAGGLCINKEGEVHIIIIDSDTIWAELYADDKDCETAQIMNFNEGPNSRERFLELFNKSVNFTPPWIGE